MHEARKGRVAKKEHDATTADEETTPSESRCAWTFPVILLQKGEKSVKHGIGSGEKE